MKFYIKKDIIEGDEYPKAWIWHGRVLPLWTNAPAGWMFRLMLPWWVVQESHFFNCLVKYQLAFMVTHYPGHGPERYMVGLCPIGEI